MAAYTIVLEASQDDTLTPVFDFASGTIEVEVEDVSKGFLSDGVAGSIAVTSGQKVEYICSDWDAITTINMSNDDVSGDISGWVLPTSLIDLLLDSTSVSGDISGWALPTTLEYIKLSQTSVSGDISGWDLSLLTSLKYFWVSLSSVSGNIGSWTFPSTLIVLRTASSNLTGDIGSWVLPANFTTFTSAVGFSGDISGWTIPAAMYMLWFENSGVSGDISGWTLPATLKYFRFDNTNIDYDSTGDCLTGLPNSLTGDVYFNGCGLTYLQVDNILADLVTSGSTTNTLSIAGNNSGPTAAGAANLATLETRTWTTNSINDTVTLLTLTGSAGVERVTPRFTFATGTVGVFVDDVFIENLSTGVEADIALLEGEVIVYCCSSYNALTKIDMANDTHVAVDVSSWALPTSLTELNLSGTDFAGSVAGWTLPNNLTKIDLGYTEVTGSVAGWTLPNNLEYFDFASTEILGSIAGFTLPSTLIEIHVNHTDVEGDISGWVLPTTLVQLRIQSTILEGDISSWDLSATVLTHVYLSHTSVSGDIGSWTFPNTLEHFEIDDTSVSGNISGWTFPNSLTYLRLSDTSFLGDISSWTINNITDLYLEDLSVSGDISGWTFPTSFDIVKLNGTSIGYGSTGGPLANLDQKGVSIYLDDCALTIQEVDNALADCVTSGLSGIPATQIRIHGTNSGPSVLGAVNRDVLIAASWNISINPVQAHTPSPADSGINIGISTNLSWMKEATAAVLVYVDKKADHDPPTTKVVDDADQTTYNPSLDLDTDTVYVWRVDTKDGTGTTTGDQWEFTTVAISGDTELSYSRSLRGIGFGMNRGVV